MMYQAACKVGFQPFKRLYSQLTFFNFLLNIRIQVELKQARAQGAGLA